MDTRSLPGRVAALLLALLWTCAAPTRAEEGKLEVIGYGVKDCTAYLEAFKGWEEGRDDGVLEYVRYREWLAGLVTGLTLAVGEDVLQGVDMESAMRRILVDCDERRESDFFGASMRLVRILSEGSEPPKE